jgi:hypothetical protein
MTRPSRTARFLPAALGLFMFGCAGQHVAPKVDAPIAGPPVLLAPTDSAAVVTVPVDTLAVVEKPPADPKPLGPVAPPATAPATTPPATTSPTSPPPEKISSEQEVAVKLDDSKKADLAAQTRKDLDEAERLVASVDSPSLGSSAKEKVDAVKSLIASSHAAYVTDVQAAAALAHKARLLAGELGKS